MFLTDFVIEASILPSRYDAFFIEHGEDAYGLILKQSDTVGVIREVERIPVNAFSTIQFFFTLEHEGIEEVLKSLIGEVDTELFEGIEGEALKAKDIKNSAEKKESLGVLHSATISDRLIRARNDLKEQTSIQRPT